MKTLPVVLGILQNQAGEFLISGRNTKIYLSDKWEFPGGKIKPNETETESLSRELFEELAIKIQKSHKIMDTFYQYPDVLINLSVYRVDEYLGEPLGAEGQKIRWVKKFTTKEMLKANVPIINSLILPDFYLITPKNQPISILKQLLSNHKNALIQYRDPDISLDNYAKNAEQLIKTAKQNGQKILLNAPVSLAYDLSSDGVHLTAKQLMALSKKPKKLITSASCHCLNDIKKSNQLSLDFSVLSPIKPTKSHPELINFLGWLGFQKIIKQANHPVYALGGLCQSDIKYVKNLCGQGVAGISAFATN